MELRLNWGGLLQLSLNDTHLMFSFVGIQASIFVVPDKGPCCELVKKLNTHAFMHVIIIIMVINHQPASVSAGQTSSDVFETVLEYDLF